MSANHEDLSTIVENGPQSSLDIIEEIECNDDGSLEEVSKITTDTNRFRILCDNVQNCFFHMDNSMFELLGLKDKLLRQSIPLNVSLHITLVLSRFYRAYSQTQIPIYELIRLVQLYSESFDMKCIPFKRLYDSNEINKRLLKIAFQRLTSMENNTKKYEEQKSINNWEKMYIHLVLPRSNIRKWKFRIKIFREKANLGYEHVIEWLHQKIPRSSSEISSNSQISDDQNTTDEISHIQKLPTDYGSDDYEIGSNNNNNNNNEDNPLNNTSNQELHQTEQKPTVTTNDIEIQAQPDLDDQQTSTEDILSTKSLIMRIYRPIGILKTKFQCIIYAHGQIYKSNVFKFNKSNVSINENKKTVSRTIKSINSRTIKRSEVLTILNDNDINTIDREQNDEILIPMPNVFKRRSLFQTAIDPDAIKIDIFGDEKFCGSLILSSEDLHMLNLPNLYNSISSSLIAIDDNVSKTSLEKHQFNFDDISNKLYQSWISRTPHLFSIYNNKHESIGKLPLIMFWYNQIEQTHATKCTMTIPMEIEKPISKIIPIQENEINEELISSIIDENNKSIDFELINDHIETLKQSYENEIAKLHEDYQAEIYRLINILNEISSKQSNQMIEISQSNENQAEMIQQDPLNINIRQRLRQNTRSKVVMEHQPSPVYGKDLPKNFLDRYHMYLQRSITHRQQLIAKVEQETALANERQMEIQHRLHKSKENNECDDDLCLPAVFMPFRSGNVFNPRAYQFFHSIGSTNPRLTQPPSILKLPSVPSRSASVLNLFELSQRYDNSNEKDHLIEKKN
ncbi:unnamed protein product [Rotaria sordida]|uniref:Uncharacterized protein n=1 Tax=Rotaria sordida TaxID=392033 RepID=A0A813YTC7_9BILA|nr:unnamed protein product [Rotaria sordida]